MAAGRIEENALYLTPDEEIDLSDYVTTEQLKQAQADWSVDDPEAPGYIKNKPKADDALVLVSEMGFIDPVADEDEALFTDESGIIYSLC